MIVSIYNLLEILSIVLCISYLYNQKFKLDIATVSVIALDLILMQTIAWLELPRDWALLIYPILIIYCIVEYGFHIRAILVNIGLFIVIVFTIQFVTMLLYVMISGAQTVDNLGFFVINLVLFIIVILVLRKVKIYRLSQYLQNKGRLLMISIVFCVLIIMFCLNLCKTNNQYVIEIIGIITVCAVLVCVLAINLGKYRIKTIEAETELKVHQLYEDSYKSLIENIRLRQHEFDNQINTVYSQHYTCKTYEELVQVQKQYCNHIEKDNHFNKLLSAGNSVIIGFLYGKFMELEKQKIRVSYKVNIKEMKCRVPEYKIIEILSDLINNAAEALHTLADVPESCDELFVSMLELDDRIEMEVRNQSPVIDYEEIQRFFQKGYSKKGEGRGLGLYNVKRISEEYNISIICDNVPLENENWLSFQIKINK